MAFGAVQNFPPPPRRVTGEAGCVLWGFRIGTLAVMGLTLWAAKAMLMGILWVASGVDVAGVVTAANPAGSTNRNYRIDYRYATPSGEFTGSQTVRDDIYERFIKPPTKVAVMVRYYQLGPFRTSGINYGESLWDGVSGLIFLTGLGAVLSFIFYWVFWMVPRRARRLVQTGIATAGIVVDKQVVRSTKTVIHKIAYAYHLASGAEHVASVMVLPGDAWEKINVGDAVTVLMDPKNEKKSTPYEFGNVKVLE